MKKTVALAFFLSSAASGDTLTAVLSDSWTHDGQRCAYTEAIYKLNPNPWGDASKTPPDTIELALNYKCDRGIYGWRIYHFSCSEKKAQVLSEYWHPETSKKFGLWTTPEYARWRPISSETSRTKSAFTAVCSD